MTFRHHPLLLGSLPFVLMLFTLAGCQSKRTHSLHKALEHVKVPQGWVLSPYNARVSLIFAEEKKHSYRIYFDRRSKTQEDARYIHLAESLFPDRDKIQKQANGSKNVKVSLPKNWYFERLWWAQEYQGIRIPFALSADAVNYYINRYVDFKSELKAKRQVSREKGDAQHRRHFFYSAKVIRPEGKSNQGSKAGVKVLLQLKWYEYCGQPCGWGFEKTRVVYFSSLDQIDRIEGDQPSKVWISSPEQPYGPGQWITY